MTNAAVTGSGRPRREVRAKTGSYSLTHKGMHD